MRGPLAFLLALVVTAALPAAALSAEEPFVPELALPIACAVGQTCHIQNLVDLDPGPDARDFTCGTATYQAHDGVDFRLPDLAAMRAGVDVLAAAPGRVRAVRDGMPDRSVRETGRQAVASRECGNGVVVDHRDGWETQYCHLGQGSIRVARGQRVEAGTVLGRVGVSGLSEYPHLHFTVRRRGATVDPFAFERDPETCGSGRPLWAPAIRASLAYRTPVVLNAGFNDGAVNPGELEAGALAERRIGADPAALVVYTRAIVLKTGDVQRLALLGPDGDALSENAVRPLERPRAQQLLFTGKRRPAAGWPSGIYTGVYTVERDGAVALRNEVRFEIPAP